MNYQYRLVASDGAVLTRGKTAENVEKARQNTIKGFKYRLKEDEKAIEEYKNDIAHLDEINKERKEEAEKRGVCRLPLYEEQLSTRILYCEYDIEYFLSKVEEYESAIIVKDKLDPYKVFFDKLKEEGEIEIRLFDDYLSICITNDDETTAEDMIRLTDDEREALKEVMKE